MLSASRVKGDLKEYGYISFDMGDRNGQTEMYLYCSEAWTFKDWTRIMAVHLNHHLMMTLIFCFLCFFQHKLFKSYHDDRTRLLIRVFTVCKNSLAIFLFVLRVYGPVNPMGSCRVRSVYLTTHLLGRLSPLSS